MNLLKPQSHVLRGVTLGLVVMSAKKRSVVGRLRYRVVGIARSPVVSLSCCAPARHTIACRLSCAVGSESRFVVVHILDLPASPISTFPISPVRSFSLLTFCMMLSGGGRNW
jgi:hypothetical protein